MLLSQCRWTKGFLLIFTALLYAQEGQVQPWHQLHVHRGLALLMQDCLLQAFQESDQSGSGHLTKQKAVLVIKGLASDLLHLSPQASCALAQCRPRFAQHCLASI